MKRARSIFLLVTMVLAVALTGCAGDRQKAQSTTENNASAKPSEGGNITVGISQDLDSLDPHYAVSAGTKEVLFNIFEGLVKPDAQGNFVNALASDYRVSEDARVYTFTLREGVTFHNGQPVTAEDVKYSIERCADTSNGDPLVSAYSIIESVNILDPGTVEIRLTEPSTEFIAYMTTAILPRDYADQATNPVGTGPFRFQERTPDEAFVMVKNEEYWGTPAHLDQVTFRIVSDADMLVTNLKGGSIDMAVRLTSAQAAELTEGFHIEEGTMNLVQALYLNNAVEPLDDVRVRQALSYAVDADAVMALVADGRSARVGSSMYPGLTAYFDESLNDYYEPDPEKAKALLEEAGYGDGFDLEITVCSADQPHMDTAQVLAEQLRQIGVNVTIKPVEWSTWLEEVYAGRNFQSTVVGVDASNLTARAMLERFTSTREDNFINFHDPEYDETFQAAITETDPEVRTSLYKDCERILTEQAANVYIQDLANLVAIRDGFEGYTFYPLYVQDMAAMYRVE